MSKKSKQNKKAVRVSAAAKDTVTTRVEAGNVIATNAPTSSIAQNQDVKTAVGNVATSTTALDAKNTKVKALDAALATERSALVDLTVDWDGAFDVLVTTARKYCVNAQDAQSLGLAALTLVAYALAMPVAVLVRYDAKMALIRVRVKRPKGLRSVRIEISPDPVTATSWKLLDGDGATAALAGYAPGTWWVRAAMVRGREVSDYTAPVAVIVK